MWRAVAEDWLIYARNSTLKSMRLIIKETPKVEQGKKINRIMNSDLGAGSYLAFVYLPRYEYFVAEPQVPEMAEDTSRC